jgi:hypothetical protein
MREWVRKDHLDWNRPIWGRRFSTNLAGRASVRE